MKPLRKFKWIMAVVALCVAGAAGSKWFSHIKQNEKSTGDARLGVVERTDLVRRVLISGQISPRRTTGIAPPFIGYVHKLFVKVGDMVRAGDPLVSVSQLPHSNGESVFPIPAPFAGKIVFIGKNEGEQVDPNGGNPQSRGGMLRIDDVSSFFVDAEVPEIDYPNIKTGQSALIALTSSPQHKFKGEIASIAAAPRSTESWDRNRVEFPVRISISNPDPSMVSGMSAIVEVITSERKGVLALKHQFVTGKDGKYLVHRSDGKEAFIEVGLQNEEYFEVISGLAEGERVRLTDFSTQM